MRSTVPLSAVLLVLTAMRPAPLTRGCWAISPAVAPTVRYVTADGTDEGDCDSVAWRCRTLQDALDVADPGDEIRLAGGQYTAGATVARITQPVRIIGSYDPAFAVPDPDEYETLLDAGGKGSGVHIDSGHSVTLERMALTHGNGSGNCRVDIGCGGGVTVRHTELFIDHSRIIENVGNSAGNQEGRGGGVYAYSTDQKVEILASQILSNTANTGSAVTYYSRGGGVFLRGGTAVLAENHLLDNLASSAGTGGQGGGIYLYGVGAGPDSP